MGKGRISKIVGKIDKKITDEYNIPEYENQNIVQYMDLYMHVLKHIPEFESIDSYNNAVLKIDEIIAKPDFVYYEKKKNSLHYFKEIDEDVCVIVKLNLRKNKDNSVSTIYPVNKNKIEKLKENKYIINR